MWIGAQNPAFQRWHPSSSTTETWNPCPQASSVLGAVAEAWHCAGLKDLPSGGVGEGSLVYGDSACSLPVKDLPLEYVCSACLETYRGPSWVYQNLPSLNTPVHLPSLHISSNSRNRSLSGIFASNKFHRHLGALVPSGDKSHTWQLP